MVENDYDKKNNTGAKRVTFPAGQLTEKFQEKTYLGFEGTRDQVMNALSKQGNESIIQTNAGDASIAISEQEKKKRDAERANLTLALEQQRQQMLDQLNNRIGKLTKEIERDQLKLEAMRNKRSGLDDLRKLVDAGKITRETPHHDVLDRAGIQDKKTFINSHKDAQKEIIKEEIVKLDPKIKELVEQLGSKMDKLAVIKEAFDELDTMDSNDPEFKVKMAEISTRLNKAEIDIAGKSLDDALGMVEDAYDQSKKEGVLVNKEFRAMEAADQVEFIKVAEKSGKLSSDQLQGYKDTMKDEAKVILEADLKIQQPISAPAI